MEFGNVIFSMGEIAGEKQTASDFRVSAVRRMIPLIHEMNFKNLAQKRRYGFIYS